MSASEVSDLLKNFGYDLAGEYLSNKIPVQARCQLCGSIEELQVNSLRKRKLRGCMSCRGAHTTRRLSSEEAQRRIQPFGFALRGEYVNKRSKVEIQCIACQSRKTVLITSILRGEVQCQTCRLANRLLAVPSSSLEELADRGFRSHGFEPLEAFRSLSTKRRCRCLSCGTEQSKSLTHLNAGTHGCSVCSGRELNLQEVDERYQRRELQPLEPYPGGNKIPRRCLCMRCGNETRVSLNAIRRGRHCRFCARRGLVRGKPGYLYLIDNPELRAIKVGVGATASAKNRIDTHIRRGWQLVNVWDFDRVEDAEAVETEVLRTWRRDGVPDALTRTEMPYGGWSETAPYLYRTAEEALDEVALIVYALTRT